MNIEISYGDHEPDLLSQSLTGRASTSLGPWRGSRQKGGNHDAHANDAAQAAAETLAAAEAGAEQARQKRAERGRSTTKRAHGPL